METVIASNLQPETPKLGGKEQIELHLSEDILQGEDVPFYIIWKNVKVEKISLEAQRFRSDNYSLQFQQVSVRTGIRCCSKRRLEERWIFGRCAFNNSY